MRKTLFCVICVALMLTAMPTWAELTKVEVGGSLRMRFNWINNQLAHPAPILHYGPFRTLGRPIGGPFAPAVVGIYDWDDSGKDYSATEMRTRLNVRASFTDDVSAFVEFESYDYWGEDFRSQDYIHGVDARANSSDDVEVFQSYIDVANMWGTPLRLRVGRQELSFGSEWLVGTGEFGFMYRGLSFDAARLTYAGDSFTVDLWASKLAENFADFGDGDIDFYGIYASCTALENHTFDLYYLLLRDDTNLGRGNWDDTLIHTPGIRAAGHCGAFDYDAEFAYQFGEADAVGISFGDRGARYDTYAAKLDLGYAFDVAWRPRVFVGARYYGGEDNRDITFWEWLSPFDKKTASVSFNRLFSDEIATGYFDVNNDMSNAWWGRIGVMAAPAEKLRAVLALTYYESLHAFDRPVMPLFTWWTREGETDLGWETTLVFEYLYSQDLTFEFGWFHLFPGDALDAGEGSYSSMNGFAYTGGTDDDDADYVYVGCKIYF